MLQCDRQNYHHSKLPKIGEIMHIAGLRGDSDNLKKCVVVAYPLTDNIEWYSKACPNLYGRGIHTCFVRLLDTGEIRRISGVWLIDEFDYSEYRYTTLARRFGVR